MAKYENQGAPYWTPGDNITGHASVALTGKRFVRIAGARVDGNPALNHSAGADVLGVAAYDTPADDKVTVYVGGVVPVVAAAAVAAGDRITSTANGEGTPATGGAGATVPYAGIALDDAAAGEDVPVHLTAGAFVA